ncbi:hypothetical protein IAD21_04899 [Abditibacteriota bacterium]|nr:hypothetical protein IAD21_04899 [Abditibacteriota bacterium]
MKLTKARMPYLTVALAAVGLIATTATPAKAYEADTHFTMTFVMCRAAGLTDAEALTVARYDQGMDDSAGTVANNGAIPHLEEEHLWHAIPVNGTPTEVLQRKAVLWSQVLNEPNPASQLKRLGVFFHYQQDTWAHRHHPNHAATGFDTFQVPLGHAAFGSQPDRPPFDPICALRCLEDGMGFARAFITTCLHRAPNPLFDGYLPASGIEDTTWSDSRKGKYFNELKLDNSTPARALLTDLIRSQIGLYSSSFDANPNFFGRSTANEVNTVLMALTLQGACSRHQLTIIVPPVRQQVTTLTTAQLKGNNLGSTDYTVRVFTGDRALAGTDANIFLSLQGTTGSISEQRLNGLISGNAFERNHTDTCVLHDFASIGTLTSITIRSDDAGLASGWFLGWVEISAPGMPTRRFTLNNWIESGILKRTLT